MIIVEILEIKNGKKRKLHSEEKKKWRRKKIENRRIK